MPNCHRGWLYLCPILAARGRDANDWKVKERAQLLQPMWRSGKNILPLFPRQSDFCLRWCHPQEPVHPQDLALRLPQKRNTQFSEGRLIISHRLLENFSPSPKHTAASAPACAIIMCVKIIAKPKIINSFIHSFMTINCSCGFLFHSSDNNYCKQNQNWIPVKLLLKHSLNVKKKIKLKKKQTKNQYQNVFWLGDSIWGKNYVGVVA